MGKNTKALMVITFALLTGAFLMVSCTSTTDVVTPPAVAAKDQTAQAVSGEVAGAPTLSPNAHAVISVTDPLGDKTPVPMYAFTPAPSPTPVTPVPTRPAATTVADESALATTMAERDPRIMTQEGAQEARFQQVKSNASSPADEDAGKVMKGLVGDHQLPAIAGNPVDPGRRVVGAVLPNRSCGGAFFQLVGVPNPELFRAVPPDPVRI